MTAIFILVAITGALFVYVPNRKDINSIVHSGYRYVQITASRKLEERYRRKHPEPTLNQIQEDRNKRKALQRQADIVDWTREYRKELERINPPEPVFVTGAVISAGSITTGSITAGDISIVKKLKRDDELSYTQRYLLSGALTYEGPNSLKVTGKIAHSEVVTIESWCKSDQGVPFLKLGASRYILASATTTKSTAGLPYEEAPPEMIRHTDFDTYTVMSASGDVLLEGKTPTYSYHRKDSDCYECQKSKV